MIEAIRKWRHDRAYKEAIEDIGDDEEIALQVISDFERINELEFDPLEYSHRLKVSGMGKFRAVLNAHKRWAHGLPVDTKPIAEGEIDRWDYLEEAS